MGVTQPMRGCRCEEEYCTKCFRDRHKKGNMRYHTTFALVYWTEGMKKCMEANEVAVVRGLVFAAAATSLSVHAVQTTHEARKELERIREERKEARKEDMAMCVCRPHACSVGASHCLLLILASPFTAKSKLGGAVARLGLLPRYWRD